MEEREAGGREKVKGERKGGRERGIGSVSFAVIIRTVCHHVHPYICLHTSPHQVECILSQTDDGTVVLVSPTLFVPPPS